MERNVISLKGNNSNKMHQCGRIFTLYIWKTGPTPCQSCFSIDQMNLSDLGSGSPKEHLCKIISKLAHSSFWHNSVWHYLFCKINLRYPSLVCKNSPFWKTTPTLTLCLQVSSADSLCKQFGPRSGPTKCRAWSGSKLFDTLMVFLIFFKKDDFEKLN